MEEEYTKMGKRTIICLLTDDTGKEYCGYSVMFAHEEDEKAARARAYERAEQGRKNSQRRAAERNGERADYEQLRGGYPPQQRRRGRRYMPNGRDGQ